MITRELVGTRGNSWGLAGTRGVSLELEGTTKPDKLGVSGVSRDHSGTRRNLRELVGAKKTTQITREPTGTRSPTWESAGFEMIEGFKGPRQPYSLPIPGMFSSSIVFVESIFSAAPMLFPV